MDGSAALLLVLLSLTAAAMVARPSHDVLPSPDSLRPPVSAVAALSGVSLLLLRQRPRSALSVAVACGVGYAVLGYDLNPVLILSMAVTLYGVAVTTDRRTAVTGAGVTATVLIVAEMAFGPGSWMEPLKLSIVAWAGMAAAAGDAVRSRRAYVAAIEERAERAERTREEEARRRVAEDRLRIARELHDVVAHHIALINAQAGVAVHLVDDLPGPVREALEHIRDSSHEALQELKATVGLLRQPDDPSAPLEPAPGLAQMPELLAAFARTGLAVTVENTGRVHPLPSAVDLTAYRIVQESLTNVRKHAGVQAAHVRLHYGSDQLAIRIEDEGRTAPLRSAAETGGLGTAAPTGTRHGLIGMRERAAVVGGTLTAGRNPWGGFQVSADLPLPLRAPAADLPRVAVPAPAPGRSTTGADA